MGIKEGNGCQFGIGRYMPDHDLGRRKWEKVLYNNQGVPDNYVDETFLDELKKNLYTRTYDFWTVVVESGSVTQQLSSVCLFAVVFVYMDQALLPPQSLFIVSFSLTLIGYILNNWWNHTEIGSENNRTRWDDIKTAVIFLAFIFGLSPVLMTLTETISTDTIYAMTVFMLLANLCFHDYRSTSTAVVSQPLSLNAAIFASVCLASRLPTTWHAFATVTFALEVFALWPVLRRKINKQSCHVHVTLTVFLAISATCCLATISTVGTVLFILVCLFITFVCPAWLIHLQPYKNNIYGPWDEAVIKD